jgi:hypothetical protein
MDTAKPDSYASRIGCDPLAPRVGFQLKARQTEAANHTLGDGAPPIRGDGSPPLDELGLGCGINHVALAEYLPVQPVRLVQHHLVQFGLAMGPLTRAEQDASPRLEPDALLVAGACRSDGA